MKVGILHDIHTGSEAFTSLFQSINAPLDFHVYEVSNGDFPESPEVCDAFLVPGSIKGVYDSDPWIGELLDFVKRIYQAQRKLVGICFGHQVIAHALGGHASKSEKGWGLGLKEFSITKKKSWMVPILDNCKLYFTHQDQVMILPSRAELLGTSDFCSNNIYCIGNRVLGIQGHPEYTLKRMYKILELLKEQVPVEIQKIALNSLNNSQPDSEIIAQWIFNFITSK
jgi:GMP synthase-like glutamine amidotransferase